MSNIAQYNISSEISDNFELYYILGQWGEETLPEYFESTAIEAVSLPSLNPLTKNQNIQHFR